MGVCLSREEEEYFSCVCYCVPPRPIPVYIYEEVPVSMLRIRVPKEPNMYVKDASVSPGRVYQE